MHGRLCEISKNLINIEAQKHYEIKTLGTSKSNSIKNLVSKALNDGQLSKQEFKIVLDEMDRYNDFECEMHTKQSWLSDQNKRSQWWKENLRH